MISAFIGRTVRDMGVGFVEPHASLTANKLAEMVKGTSDPAMVAKAKSLGGKIVAEDGVRTAVGPSFLPIVYRSRTQIPDGG